MERSTRRFHGAAAVLYSFMLWSDVIIRSTTAATTKSMKAVSVGVVLDLTSDGRRILACVSVALEDFYAEHPNNAIRVAMHVRDSHGNLHIATHAAEDLIKNVQVQAIIVTPQTSAEAELFAQLGSRNRILVLSFSDMSPTLRLQTTPFFVHTSVKESFQTALIAGILTSFSPGAKRRKLEGENLGKMCGGLPKVPLKIGLPRKDGFKEFLNVVPPYLSCHSNSSLPSTPEQFTGCSMDFFKAAMMKLQLDHRCYEFCVFEGTYDELVRDVSLGNLDGAVGDLTITSERTKDADFTMPYTQSGVYLLVLAENDMESIQWIFVKPLTWELWFATVVFFFFTGFVVWMIERPRNPEYQGSRLRQFITASYFAFSTLTFSHDQIIRSPLSKMVVVIWCFVVLILVQSYTASLSSMLTAEKLRPSVKDLDQLLIDGDKVGYQTGSFVQNILTSQGWNDSRLSNYSTKDQYAEALRKGSKHDGVSAIVEEIPFLTSFLSDPQYQKEFQMVKTIYKTPGFGFAFPLGFPLLHNLSTAILNVTGGDEGSQIEAKWLGTDSLPSSYDRPNPDSTPLTLQSFSGLFIISGCISLAMLLISIGKLLRARWTKARDGNVQSIHNNAFGEESRPLQNSTSNIYVLDQPHPEARNEGADGSGEAGGVEQSHAIQNDMGNKRDHDQLSEAISNNSQAICRSTANAPCDGRSAVDNGFVPAQSFQINMSTV